MIRFHMSIVSISIYNSSTRKQTEIMEKKSQKNEQIEYIIVVGVFIIESGSVFFIFCEAQQKEDDYGLKLCAAGRLSNRKR